MVRTRSVVGTVVAGVVEVEVEIRVVFACVDAIGIEIIVVVVCFCPFIVISDVSV